MASIHPDLWYDSLPTPVRLQCLLCSRTSGSLTVQNGVHAFFRRFPTPSAVICADEELVLPSLSSPFGLAASRYKASCPQSDPCKSKAHPCLCAISARALRASVDLSRACARAPSNPQNARDRRARGRLPCLLIAEQAAINLLTSGSFPRTPVRATAGPDPDVKIVSGRGASALPEHCSSTAS